MARERNPTTLGERVLLLRRRADMTQSQLSEASGISANTIARLERGAIQDMRTQHVIQLAMALRVTPHDLMGWEDNDESKAA